MVSLSPFEMLKPFFVEDRCGMDGFEVAGGKTHGSGRGPSKSLCGPFSECSHDVRGVEKS
jgi:hypothetical protein